MPEKTLFKKIWEAHVVDEEPGKPTLIYIDLPSRKPEPFESLGRRDLMYKMKVDV